MTAGNVWGADAPISMPEPPRKDQPVMVDLRGGFAMTTGGIVHNITEELVSRHSRPYYAPTGDQV
jgi:hypothetical protein